MPLPLHEVEEQEPERLSFPTCRMGLAASDTQEPPGALEPSPQKDRGTQAAWETYGDTEQGQDLSGQLPRKPPSHHLVFLGVLANPSAYF